MIVYGRNPVREALRGRRAHCVSVVWATAATAREPWLDGVTPTVCEAQEIERRCGSSAHQGICAEAGGYPYVGSDELLLAAGDPLIVVLDQVQDPQNLGSICRTAECAGATGIVIGERRSAEVTPAACKASAGAVEHMRVARVRNIADFLGEASRAGCWSYGASAPAGAGGTATESAGGRGAGGTATESAGGRGAGGTATESAGGRGAGGTATESAGGRGAGTTAGKSDGWGAGRRGDGGQVVPYTDPDYSGGVVLVLGSEGSGLRPRVAASCDQLVSLPMRGRIESLGVAAAAAALLYGILQAREAALDKVP